MIKSINPLLSNKLEYAPRKTKEDANKGTNPGGGESGKEVDLEQLVSDLSDVIDGDKKSTRYTLLVSSYSKESNLDAINNWLKSQELEHLSINAGTSWG